MENLWWGVFATFGASLVPGMDLRIGIPIGAAMGIPVPWAAFAATSGNVLQIGLIAAFVDMVYKRAARWPKLHGWILRTQEQALRYERWIKRFGWLGLVLFVIVPLPGTGVVGGVILARLLRMSNLVMWSAIGVAITLTGLIFGLGTHGTMRLIKGF